MNGSTFRHCVRQPRTLSRCALGVAILICAPAAWIWGQAGNGPAPVIVVAEDGSGDYRTINEAIAAATDNATIRIHPGTYNESLTLTRPLHLEGEEKNPRAVNIISRNGPCLRVTAESGSLRWVTLRYHGFDVVDCLVIERGNFIAEHNVLSSKGGSVVSVTGQDTNPLLRRNLIRDGRDAGILVYQKARGSYEDNEITGNELGGFAITSGGDPIVRNNRIYKNPGVGLEVFQGGKGKFIDNELANNGQSGVSVKEGGAPTLRGNRIHSNGEAGIWIHNNGGGHFEANRVFENRLEGIDVTSGNPVLINNRVYKNGRGSLIIRQDARGTYRGNTETP